MSWRVVRALLTRNRAVGRAMTVFRTPLCRTSPCVALLAVTVAVGLAAAGCRARPVALAIEAGTTVAVSPVDAHIAPPSSATLVPATATTPEPPEPTAGATYPPFKKTALAVEQLAKMVAAAPELARLGGNVALFDPGDSPYLRRSKADRDGYTITPLPVLWSPADGVELLVVVGRGKEGSFVAAWWPLPDGSYRLASTFVMLGEVAPVALAFRPPERTMLWTTCWRCNGEMGHLALRDDRTVTILQD